MVEATTYAVLCDLLAPDNLQAKDINVLFEMLRDHYEHKPLMVGEWFYFYQRSQKPLELESEYVAELCKLSVRCEFVKLLNDMLRDCFMCRLKNATLQKNLCVLSKKNLIFMKVVEIAQGAEAAEKG